MLTHYKLYCYSTGVLSSDWLCAIVTTSGSKVKLSTFSEYRAISLTPILSRLAEKFVVQNWLRPAIPLALISDQYAFKLTGSTTVAVVQQHSYVRRVLNKRREFGATTCAGYCVVTFYVLRVGVFLAAAELPLKGRMTKQDCTY